MRKYCSNTPHENFRIKHAEKGVSCGESRYGKRDNFESDLVNVPFFDGDVPLRASYGVNVSQLIRFASIYKYVTVFNTRNKC